MTNQELISLVKSLSSKVETLKHQLFLFHNARFGRQSEKDAASDQMSFQFNEAGDTTVETELKRLLIPAKRKRKVI